MSSLSTFTRNVIVCFNFLSTEICGPDYYNLTLGNPLNLTSPFYPNTYPEKWQCLWFITPKDQGFPVMNVIDMVTEKGVDDIIIGSADNASNPSSRLFNISDEIGPLSISFGVPNLWVQFRTNHRTGFKGFVIELQLNSVFGKRKDAIYIIFNYKLL